MWNGLKRHLLEFTTANTWRHNSLPESGVGWLFNPSNTNRVCFENVQRFTRFASCFVRIYFKCIGPPPPPLRRLAVGLSLGHFDLEYRLSKQEEWTYGCWTFWVLFLGSDLAWIQKPAFRLLFRRISYPILQFDRLAILPSCLMAPDLQSC